MQARKSHGTSVYFPVKALPELQALREILQTRYPKTGPLGRGEGRKWSNSDAMVYAVRGALRAQNVDTAFTPLREE